MRFPNKEVVERIRHQFPTGCRVELLRMDGIINHTMILHFCGKRKPWQKQYTGKFHSLYKHYEKLAK